MPGADMSEIERLIDAVKQGAIEDVRSMIENRPDLIHERDPSGATALHYAAFEGRRQIVELLVLHGADINARDTRYRATPAGWAIEYLREVGGFLGIELSDFAHAIRKGDVEWTARFLQRFPSLREAADENGIPFRTIAKQSEAPEIVRMFEPDAVL
jgi:ankyrin repeat protein